MAPNELRTLSLITKRQRDAGYSWLGGQASLEEYEVAAWCEQHIPGQYIYQATFTLFSGVTTKVDFEIIRAPRLVWFIQGDKWHQGMDQRVYDREQELAVSNSGVQVVEIWGHSIRAYPGFPIPTDESFNTVMEAALSGHQTHTAWS